MIGCVGPWNDKITCVINLGTGGIPGYSIHHVGQVARDWRSGKLYIYESTESERPPCAVRHRVTEGVQATAIDDFLAIPFYTKVWVYPNRYDLYENEQRRLNRYVYQMLGTKYDERGAIQSGGLLWATINSFLQGENLNQLFCSEFVAATRIHTGILKARNASWWSPNRLCRHLVRAGECGKPYRIK